MSRILFLGPSLVTRAALSAPMPDRVNFASREAVVFMGEERAANFWRNAERAGLARATPPDPGAFATAYARGFADRSRAAWERALMEGGEAHARLPEVIQVIAVDEVRRAFRAAGGAE